MCFFPLISENPVATGEHNTHQGETVEGVENTGRQWIISVSVSPGGDWKFEEKLTPANIDQPQALADIYNGNVLQKRRDLRIASVQVKLDICRKLPDIVLELHDEDIIHSGICASNVKLSSGTVILANARLFAEIQRKLKHVPLFACTRYRCKEVLASDDFVPSKADDIYSLTVLFYVIFAEKEPYSATPLVRVVPKIAGIGHTGLDKPAAMPPALWSALEDYWNAPSAARLFAFGVVQAVLV